MSRLARLWHWPVRVVVRTLGRASHGIRLALDEGLTSGKMLEYVYRNEPGGRWLFGAAVDRMFLSQPGWEAIRTRRANLEALMLEAIESLRGAGRTPSILDIASGPAGYILAVVERSGAREIHARCWDIDPRWLEQGAAEARRRGLGHIVFEPGDAFDAEQVLAVRPQPNLVVASGFYDWIVDDEFIQRSIGLVFQALEPGGYFALTVQCGHANLALVEAVFTDFHHAPLRMKVRLVAEVEEWLRTAGFHVVDSRADSLGYYAATLAQKPAA